MTKEKFFGYFAIGCVILFVVVTVVVGTSTVRECELRGEYHWDFWNNNCVKDEVLLKGKPSWENFVGFVIYYPGGNFFCKIMEDGYCYYDYLKRQRNETIIHSNWFDSNYNKRVKIKEFGVVK